MAFLRLVNHSRQLSRPQFHPPTTTHLPSLPVLRARFMSFTSITKLRVHTLCMAVLLHPPSCSTNPHGTASIFSPFLHGGILHPRHLVFHFPTTSGPQSLPLTQFTYKYCRNATFGVLRRGGRRSTRIIPQAIPRLLVQDRVVPHIHNHNFFIGYLTPYGLTPFSGIPITLFYTIKGLTFSCTPYTSPYSTL